MKKYSKPFKIPVLHRIFQHSLNIFFFYMYEPWLQFLNPEFFQKVSPEEGTTSHLPISLHDNNSLASHSKN